MHKNPPDERSTVIAVTNLINRGWLENRGDRLVMDSKLKKLMEILSSTKYSISIFFNRSILPQKCVYISGDDAASLEMDISRQGFIKAELLKYGELVDELVSNDFISAGSCVNRSADEHNILKTVNEYIKSRGAENDNILLSIQRFCKNAVDIEIFLVRDVLSDVFLIRTSDTEKLVMYSADRLWTIFRLLSDKTGEEILKYDFS